MDKIVVNIRDVRYIKFPRGVKVEVFFSIPDGMDLIRFLDYCEIEKKIEKAINEN